MKRMVYRTKINLLYCSNSSRNQVLLFGLLEFIFAIAAVINLVDSDKLGELGAKFIFAMCVQICILFYCIHFITNLVNYDCSKNETKNNMLPCLINFAFTLALFLLILFSYPDTLFLGSYYFCLLILNISFTMFVQSFYINRTVIFKTDRLCCGVREIKYNTIKGVSIVNNSRFGTKLILTADNKIIGTINAGSDMCNTLHNMLNNKL